MMESYDELFSVVSTTQDCINKIQELTTAYTQALYVTDSNIRSLYPHFFDHFPCLEIPHGEEAKKLEILKECWDAFFQNQLDRQSVIVAIGGGSITDVAGFAASTFLRGISIIHVPTTLLGMVDAAVGGKTAINTPYGKNTLGTFYQPYHIVTTTAFLATLPEREYISGLAEVVKYGVIEDPSFFAYLEKHTVQIKERDPSILIEIIKKSVLIKQKIVKEDFKEKGRRAILNWGHTFAHAIEHLTDYKNYTHGEAVSLGMHLAAKLSLQLGKTSKLFVEKQASLLQRLGLSVELPNNLNISDLINGMFKDKKSLHNNLYLIIAEGIGQVSKQGPIEAQAIYDCLEGELLCKS